jgi:phosphatidylinositol dimannoside acyltransferase
MKFEESPLKKAYRVGFWYGLRPALRGLPPGHEFQVFRALGRQASRLPGPARDRIQANLGRVFPDPAQRDEVLVRAYEEHFCTQYVSFTFPRIDSANRQHYIRLHGVEHLQRALAPGRGAVLAHPHMGCAQLPHFPLAARGYRMMQIGGGGTNLRLARMGRRVARARTRLESLLPAEVADGKAFLRPALRHLRGGGVLLTAVDGTGSGEEIGRREVHTVFGHRFRVPVGPVYLAYRADAALLPLLVVRREDGPGFDGFIEPEIPIPDIPLDGVLAWGAELMALMLDRWLRRHPGEWDFWDEFHPGPGGLLVTE